MSFLDNSGKGNDIRSRFVLSSKEKGKPVLGGSRVGRVKGEKTVVPMYSDFFSRANGNMMVTANMYEMLHKEIQAVVAWDEALSLEDICAEFVDVTSSTWEVAS